MNRPAIQTRQRLRARTGQAALTLVFPMILVPACAAETRSIDRRALVTRHNIECNALDGQIPLGNGGLLCAAAMMAAGGDGAPANPAPGFPQDGSWTVKGEGLKKAP